MGNQVISILRTTTRLSSDCGLHALFTSESPRYLICCGGGNILNGIFCGEVLHTYKIFSIRLFLFCHLVNRSN